MKYLRGLLTHLGMLLPIMALIFLVLDRFNPAMGFWSDPLAKAVIASALVLALANAIRLIVQERTK